MRSPVLLSLMILFVCITASAQEFNNHTKKYELVSQTAANIEVTRMHRRILCDYQPSGLYVRRGERVSVTVTDLDEDYKLSTMIGFKPMWETTTKRRKTN